MNNKAVKFKRAYILNIKKIFTQKTGINPDGNFNKHTLAITKNRIFGKTSLAAIAIIIVLLFTFPMLAFNVPNFYNFLFMLSPSTAQYFKPVQLSCEDNGIRMEVISSYIHDGKAEIYISLRDLTGTRIDKTTDLFDSYSINIPFNSDCTCFNAGYDEQTKTVLFLIEISGWGNKNIEGNKVTLFVNKFLSNKLKIDIPLDIIKLNELEKNPKTITTFVLRGGGSDNFENIIEDIKLLLPDKKLLTPTEGVSITAAGYVDGKLHIQLYFEDILKTDNHGYVYFKKNDGTEIYSQTNIAFWDDNHIGSYEEYIFDISTDNIEQYKLFGNFVTCKPMTEGNWSVTFAINNESK